VRVDAPARPGGRRAISSGSEPIARGSPTAASEVRPTRVAGKRPEDAEPGVGAAVSPGAVVNRVPTQGASIPDVGTNVNLASPTGLDGTPASGVTG